MSAAAGHPQPKALPLPDLPAPILQRLAAHGITTAEHWVTLGRRRLLIFGVTRSMAAQIDTQIGAQRMAMNQTGCQ
jgi:hypothetical protein